PAPLARRAPARGERHPGRRPGGDRRRHRRRDHRPGDRRGRPRRVHLPRSPRPRQRDDPRRRRAGRAAGRRRRREPGGSLAAPRPAPMRWILSLLVLAAGCARGGDVVVVGAKNFTEQLILGELVAQTVEAAGLRADRRLDLGGTYVCDHALRGGDIDVYVEYTGTALTAILKEPPGGSRDAVLARVRAAYAPAGLVC